MITFIQTIIQSSKTPPAPNGVSMGGGPVGPPGAAPIDNGLIFLLFIGIAFGCYMHYKKIQHKKVNAKNSLN